MRLNVLYVSEPSPSQQGAQFQTRFEWDVPLRDGYDNRVLRSANGAEDFGSDRFWGVDAPGIGAELEATKPTSCC